MMKFGFRKAKVLLALLIAAISWIGVIAQYDLMLLNRISPVLETTIRFFSFFTILTNTMVGVFFTYLLFNSLKRTNSFEKKFGTLTAVTVYITIVGLIYQIILRHTWNPMGTQKIVDELLHSVTPVLVIVYWLLNRKNGVLSYNLISFWLIYPLGYLIYVLFRGYFSNFYPYPFLNITEIGFVNVVINSIYLTVLFAIISMLYIWINRSIIRPTAVQG